MLKNYKTHVPQNHMSPAHLLSLSLVDICGPRKLKSSTCLPEQGSVRSLRVSEETTNSFRVSWQPAPGAVLRYHLTYEPVGDAGSRMEMATDGPETTVVLQGLRPETTYRVIVTPEYQSGSGVPLQTDGTTKEGQ